MALPGTWGAGAAQDAAAGAAASPAASVWFETLNILVSPHFSSPMGGGFSLYIPLTSTGEHGQPHQLQPYVGKSHLLTKGELLAIPMPGVPSWTRQFPVGQGSSPT